MKAIIYLIVFVIFFLLTILYLGVTELRDVNRIQQKTIDGLREANKKEKDSLQTQLAITRDSLSTAFATIRQAAKDREIAHERTQATIRNLQKIIYIQYTDSSRTAELKELYKSFNP